MGKITPIIVKPNPGFDTGETAKDKINEAMKTVEHDVTLDGDGTASSPLSFLGRIFNALKTQYTSLVSLATTTRTATFQNKDTLIADLYDGIDTQYLFNDSVAAGNPGSSYISFDNETLSEASFAYISHTQRTAGNIGSIIQNLAVGSTIIVGKHDRTNIWTFTLSSLEHLSGYSKLGLTNITIGTSFTLDDIIGVGMYNKGAGDTYHPDPSIALSDETTDLTTDNDAKLTLTRAQTFTAFSASVTTAPVGSSLLVLVKNGATTIATITIASGSVFGTTTTISNTAGAVGDVITFDCTQIGATTAGIGLKCYTLSDLA